MNEQKLCKTANHLFNSNKGLLAMDESTHTCNARFHALGIAQTIEARCSYRELLITTPGLESSISGVILCDETFNQKLSDGQSFLQQLAEIQILPGIKVDTGLVALAGFPGNTLTLGLDGLRERLQNYATQGAQFAKWRAAFRISATTPDRSCIDVNAVQMAMFAALCQECGLVPIVEPEVLMDGAHTIGQCANASEQVWEAVIHHLHQQRVFFEGLILKTNMILPGAEDPAQVAAEEIAAKTVMGLMRYVPAAVPGIVFLSGGQTPEVATTRLNMINRQYKTTVPWPMSFSYSRAIQQPVLASWAGDNTNRDVAQRILIHRVRCNQAALNGDYHAQMESAGL